MSASCGAGARIFAFSTPSIVILLLTLRILPANVYAHGEQVVYTQQPTLEYPADCGPYDFVLTASPGRPVPGEPASLAFSIRNRQTQRDYPDPVTLRVLQRHTFGDDSVILLPTRLDPMDSEIPGVPHYSYCVDFPANGRYVVELSVLIDGKTQIVPFRISAGESTVAAWWVVLGSSGFIMSFVVVRAVQVKRRRRAALSAGAPA